MLVFHCFLKNPSTKEIIIIKKIAFYTKCHINDETTNSFSRNHGIVLKMNPIVRFKLRHHISI